MAAPTNISFATATDLGTLGYTATETSQTVHDSGTTYEVFHKFTAPIGAVVVGIAGRGDLTVYRPTLRLYEGPAGAPTLLFTSSPNTRFQYPVTGGTEYFIKSTSNAGNPSPATLHLDAKIAPNDPVRPGDMIIPDDEPGFPAAVVDPATGCVRRFIHPFASGEAGDTLPSGIMAVEDQNDNTVKIYDENFNQLASVAANPGTLFGSIRANPALNRFYALNLTPNPDQIVAIGADGSTVATHTMTGHNDLGSLAVSNDGSTMYWGKSSGNDGIIYSWDLASGTANANLVASGETSSVFDILVLGDGSVLASFVLNDISDIATVRHYSPAGALLHTYDFSDEPDLDFPLNTPPRLARGDTDSSFRYWTHHQDGVGRLRTIQISDGATLSTSGDILEYEEGEDTGPETLDTFGCFGVSFSCPLIIARGPLVEDDSIPGAECCDDACGCSPCCGTGKAVLTGRIGPGIQVPVEGTWDTDPFAQVIPEDGRIYGINLETGERVELSGEGFEHAGAGWAA